LADEGNNKPVPFQVNARGSKDITGTVKRLSTEKEGPIKTGTISGSFIADTLTFEYHSDSGRGFGYYVLKLVTVTGEPYWVGTVLFHDCDEEINGTTVTCNNNRLRSCPVIMGSEQTIP
jgi:hypothetical protein